MLPNNPAMNNTNVMLMTVDTWASLIFLRLPFSAVFHAPNVGIAAAANFAVGGMVFKQGVFDKGGWLVLGIKYWVLSIGYWVLGIETKACANA